MSKHTSIRMKDDVHAKLVRISELSGMTVSQVVRWILGRTVDKALKHFEKIDFEL